MSLPARNGSKKCVCGSSLENKVKCLAGEKVGLETGNCTSHNDGETLVGSCLYTPKSADIFKSIYTVLPKNVLELDDVVCGWINRSGVLCSQCISGLSIL